MNLTKEKLSELNFKCDNPDAIFPKYYKTGENPVWRISVDAGYVASTTEIAYSVSAWKCNETGAIVKRCQAGYIRTTEELELIKKIVEIDDKED
jgi:hypothetical protein